MMPPLDQHKLLVANRGEIAVRIICTARRLGVPTVAIYTRTDSTSPHVTLADEAVLLLPHVDDPHAHSRGYLDVDAIVEVCKSRGVTLVHPGYGFLSENADFAEAVERVGMTWLGPGPDIIRVMGQKHTARKAAVEAGVPVVPGSGGLVHDVEAAVAVATVAGFPVMLKATAGGGGMGLIVCQDADDLRTKFVQTQARAQVYLLSVFHLLFSHVLCAVAIS